MFTDTKTVSEKQINGGLVAGYIAPGTTNFPQVVPLESSLARKDGRTWRKFDPAESQLPTKFISEDWIQKAWEEQNRSTTLQKVGKLIKHQVSSKDVQIQLDTISKEVRERIGANTEVLLPVRIPGKPEIQKALVNISQLLTTFHLASTWESYEPKFWEVMQKEKIDKKLMPDDFGDTPVTAKSLAVTISSVQEILAAKELPGGGQGSFSVTEKPGDVEDYTDQPLAALQYCSCTAGRNSQFTQPRLRCHVTETLPVFAPPLNTHTHQTIQF